MFTTVIYTNMRAIKLQCLINHLVVFFEYLECKKLIDFQINLFRLIHVKKDH